MIKTLKFDKKMFVAAGLLGLLVMVAVVNQFMNQSQTTGKSNASQSAAAFAAYRTERNTSRQHEMEVLDAIIANQDTETTMRTQAQSQKLALATQINVEVDVETMLKSKGLADCIVQYTEDNANIMVNMPQLTTAQVAQVVEAVSSRTTLTTEQIKIVPTK